MPEISATEFSEQRAAALSLPRATEVSVDVPFIPRLIRGDNPRFQDGPKRTLTGVINKLDLNFDNLYLLFGVEDLERRYVALVTELFGLSQEEAERDYQRQLSRKFRAASQHDPVVEVVPSVSVLTIPAGVVPRFEGRASEIYDFLLKTYEPGEGRQPLTLEFLRSHDMSAVKAFRSRRRSSPVPDQLRVLTAEGVPSRELGIIQHYGVDLDSPSGVADARKLASALIHRLYR